MQNFKLSLSPDRKTIIVRIPIKCVFESVLPTKRGYASAGVALTPREHEVFEFLRSGLGNKEIADRLNITVRTAKYHVSSILAKLSLPDRSAVHLKFGKVSIMKKSA